MPELVALLADEDRYVRMTAVTALGNIGPQAKDAIPAINEALNDEDEVVRRDARLALEKTENRRSVAEGEPTVPEDTIREQETPSASWTTQTPYAGDARNRPPGTICVKFDDGYCWPITGSVLRWEKSVDGDAKIQAAITATRRYEHVLGTHEVRIIDPLATPAIGQPAS